MESDLRPDLLEVALDGGKFDRGGIAGMAAAKEDKPLVPLGQIKHIRGFHAVKQLAHPHVIERGIRRLLPAARGSATDKDEQQEVIQTALFHFHCFGSCPGVRVQPGSLFKYKESALF
ncbi:hypothetical protein K3G39_19795 [Pontibacter sp. HSC-14F20]|uniref:hypothetical protein n=1 Tax=Pontibacter sp. HSC-14F20 TaxID=2864136 RepID=UPI001C73223D|nr:hypothetical protein [Pontibacter sp. HSC-14F20]MBX0335484.1 hypothetical protein [Pontibacter sp. HSC-14F20]